MLQSRRCDWVRCCRWGHRPQNPRGFFQGFIGGDVEVVILVAGRQLARLRLIHHMIRRHAEFRRLLVLRRI